MTSLMKTTFGEYIRLLRNENELTLTQLAAKLNLDSANLSKIEQNLPNMFDNSPNLSKSTHFKFPYPQFPRVQN